MKKATLLSIFLTKTFGAHSNQEQALEEYIVPDNHFYDEVYSAWRCALEGEDCECDGPVVYAVMTDEPGVTFEDVVALPGSVLMSVSPQSIKCTTEAFGTDPDANSQKQCVC